MEQLNALIAHILDNTNDARLTRWATDLNRVRNNGKRVALKTWLANHDTLETMQISFNGERIVRGWMPGPREVAHHATYATFNGSRRSYAEVTCVGATDSTWVGWDKNAETLVCYSTI